MAKSKMNIKYKTKKRERNKKKEVVDPSKEMKSNIITICFVAIFITLVYFGALALEKSGVFEKGYTKPDKVVEINYTNILIGEVFNRTESEYLVLFDNYYDDTYDVYVRYLSEKYKELPVYYVDMSIAPNNKFISENVNTNPKNISDFKINDRTLIRVLNGKVAEYIIGSDNITNYLK